MEKVAVSILCGGKSSRMQSEKGLVLFQGKAFIEHIIEAALPISNKIQLVTNTSAYDYLSYEKINDIELNKGPIGGIYSALVHSENEINLILSCDIPLISTEILLELIAKHTTDFEVSVFSNANKIHPLIGIYSKKMIPILKKAIDDNDLKMMRLLNKVNHQIIEVEEEKSKQFRNVNSLAELNELNTNLY
ncbi:molybdenum cofactor guanylyltransferase [Flavobacterium flavipallidum]|uniref:Probable molybdenum cofactor guanylyltransferase n=1 Tax=Flavobacterium flavipallidum TaxID=3139140 RepID=A0ABU9HNY7_9FLAO